MEDPGGGYPPFYLFAKGRDQRLPVPQGGQLNAFRRPAVFFPDNDILGDIDQTPGEITGVGGTQSGVGQALPGAMGRKEELQDGKALPEIGLNRQVNDAPGGI